RSRSSPRTAGRNDCTEIRPDDAGERFGRYGDEACNRWSLKMRHKKDESAPHRIIVIGGGAGGLELVTGLGGKLGRRKVADVTLIDKSRTHLWKPLLHEVAAGSIDFAVQEMEFAAQAHWHHFHYRIGELIGLDRTRREVQVAPYLDSKGCEVLGRRSFPYDTLVIAVGSHGNDFGTPGVREHAILLDSADDAKRFHERLLISFVRAQTQSGQLKPQKI